MPELNRAQQGAVDTIEGPVMVLAGPGTGKTQTLAMRIANILQKTEMDPWNILCLTFTESGVTAMRTRLVSIIGTPAYYVRIHTFHSFCNDIMKEHPELFALSSSWNQLADVEYIELLRELIDDLSGTSKLKPFGDPYMYVQDIGGNIKKLKQEDISPQDFRTVLKQIQLFVSAAKKHAELFFQLKPKDRTEAACIEFFDNFTSAATSSELPQSLLAGAVRIYQHYSEHALSAEDARSQSGARTAFKNAIKKWYEKLENQLPRQLDMCTVYEGYQDALRTRGRYDYEDMIMMVVSELKKNDELLAEYQEQFQYILVDEYQDTNGAQNEVVALLTSFDEVPNIFVVGDDKQSIYRFQGASLNNMLDFYEKYKQHITIVSLQENYRSQPAVLESADAVIGHNKESISKYIPGVQTTLFPVSGRTAQNLEHYIFDSEDAEDYAIATHVQDLIDKGSEPRDIAVLFRYNRDGTELFYMMQRLGIPVRLETGENIFDTICVRQMLHLLEYIADMRREDIVAELLQFDWLQFNSLDVLKIVAYAGSHHEALLQVIGEEAQLRQIGVSDAAAFVKFQHQLAQWKYSAANSTLQEFLHQVFEESGWLSFILERDDKVSCLQKMTRLLQEAKQLNEAQHALTVGEFMRRLRILQDHGVALETEAWQTVENAVHLMTAHKAKGLEFEHVVISRMNNKHWGNNPDPAKLPLPHGFIKYDYLVAGENNEDERRLFYVALTRAKQSIFLTRAKHSSTGRPTVPSLFISEIPNELLTVHTHSDTQQDVIDRTVRGMVSTIPKLNQDGIRVWLKLLLKDHVLSVTHINNYLECPRKFYIKNVLRVPSVRTPHQALGSAAHGALEYFFAQYEKTGSIPPESELVSSFHRFLQREVLTAEQVKDAREVGEKILQEYYRNYKNDFIRDTKREYNFASHGIVVDGVPLTGLIDKIELLDTSDKQKNGLWREGARVNIVDYKTGKPENGLKKLSKNGDYYRQLVFYKLLCDESPRFPFIFASAEIDFIQKSEKKGFIKKQITISDEEVSELRKQIKEIWNQIQNLAFFEDGSGCGKPDCEYCA
ncbi:MAG TPA: ATP-dependent DNA helicase [Candidatus Andersenbacteria bacterium]|nr:ATP-dependent DNA helicase [Candidatus Andersenbacteria bacterium]